MLSAGRDHATANANRALPGLEIPRTLRHHRPDRPVSDKVPCPPVIDLYVAIWRVSGRRQVILILLSLVIAALAAVPLSYQKEIINALTDGDMALDALLRLGAGMMAFIVLSLGLKWLMGYLSGILGEDIIRVLRKRIYTMSREAPGENRAAVPTGTLTTAISAEAEELGKFTGSAFSEPVVQIGTLISVIGYVASTQPGLGTIALLMIAPQVVLVLVSQRQVNRLVADRVRVLRQSSDRIVGSDIDTVAQGVLDDFDAIFATRRRIFIWKLSTKFVLSTINGAGLVGVLMLGGWLVLQGRTDVGTVVAALIGLGRVQAPTAFLIAFYRQVSATRVKFDLLREIIREA